MDIDLLAEGVDAGFDVDQLAMLERLIRTLRGSGVTNEAELYDACVMALRIRPLVPHIQSEMN